MSAQWSNPGVAIFYTAAKSQQTVANTTTTNKRQNPENKQSETVEKLQNAAEKRLMTSKI